VVGYDDYDPWGMIMDGRSMTASADLPNKFTGKEHDDDFGLNWDYFGARYYDAVVGRWMVVDPILSKETQEFLISNGLLGVSPYNYTLSRPTVFTDPDGEFCPQCVAALIGGAVGGVIGGGLEFVKQANGGKLTDIGNFSLSRNFDGGRVAAAAARGVITGAVAGATGGLTLSQSVTINAVAGGAGGVVDRVITGDKVLSPTAVVTDVIAGGVGGAVANVVGNQVTGEVVEKAAGRAAAGSVGAKVAQKVVQKLPSIARSVSKAAVKKASEKLQQATDQAEKDN